jgi:hypothetical protein
VIAPAPRTAVPGGTNIALAPTSVTTSTAAPLPTAVPATPVPPLATPSPTPAVIIVPQTVAPQTNEQRWRAQQLERQPFDPPQQYVATQETPLLWYDPLIGQSLEIGRLSGPFMVTAQFVLRNGNQPALEVPYRINQDYGLTSISDAIKGRMSAAGFTQSVQAYVVQTDAVQPR